MSGVLDRANGRLSAVRRYERGRHARRADGKLSSNESPLGPWPRVRAAIARSAHQAHRYPDVAELRGVVAADTGVEPARVVLGNGSDELCYLVATLFIEPGARVVLSDPGYRIDEIVTRVALGTPVFVALRDGRHDTQAMAEAARGAAVVWLPTPHNPTGSAVAPADLERLLAAAPEDCLVVVDEAYRAFADPGRRPDVPALLSDHANLVVQRTFSKLHALAGLRVGYGVTSPEIAEAIDRIRPPFNVNAAGVAAARAALADGGWAEYAVALVGRERSRFERALADLGWTYYPSQANFVTVRPPRPAELQDALADEGIMVRDGSDLGMDGWLRVSIGAPAEMARVRRACARHAGAAG